MKLKYLGTPLTNEICAHEQFKSRLNSRIIATFQIRIFCHISYLQV